MIAAKKIHHQDPGETYATVDVADIDDSPLNPRKTYGDLTELKESIRTSGLIHPPLLRPHPTIPGRFELVCGHRRVRACRELGTVGIGAIIRELSDRAVVELQLIENSTREDVPPIEEAEAYGRLHKDFGVSVEAIADKVGKSVSHVQRRMRLNDLSPEVKDAVGNRVILANAAIMLSRLESHADQNDVVRRFVDDFRKHHERAGAAEWVPTTERDLRWALEENLRELSEAPFNVGDKKLVAAAGACTACPKRTKAQTNLFADTDEEDRCTDGDCWRSKVHAHGLVNLGKTKAKVLTPEEAAAAGVFGEYGRLDPKKFVALDKKVDVYSSSNKKWKDVVKDKIEPVVVVDGAGEAHLVVPTKEAKKLLPPEKDKPAVRSLSTPKADPLDDEIDDAVKLALTEAVKARAKKKQDVELLRFLAEKVADACWYLNRGGDKVLDKARTSADLIVSIADSVMFHASEDGDVNNYAADLLGKKEADAIALKVENEIRAKSAPKDITKPAAPKKKAKAKR